MRAHLSILLLATVATLSAATPPITSANFTRTISETSQFIQDQMAAHGVEGVSIALIDHEQIVWAQGFGWADRAAAKPVAPDTAFHVGSVSKMFATAAIMALVDDGKVDLDAPVVRYLPSFRLRSPGFEDITVRMLLNHQSGMPGSMYNWALTTQPIPDYTDRLNEWLSAEYRQYPARFTTVYTNDGFELAEEVVVAVSGKPYIDFLRERIIGPLSLKQTGIDFMDPTLAAALSKPYVAGKEQPQEFANFIGTGGLSSTPSDLCRYLAMINGGGAAFGSRVLRTESVALMARDSTTDTVVRIPQSSTMPGLGWDNQSELGLAYAGAAQWKSGATGLFSADVITFPKYSLAVAVAANNSNAGVHLICLKALIIALEERYGVSTPAPPVPPVPAPADLSSLAGLYGSSTFNGIWQLRTVGQTAELWLQSGSPNFPMFTGLGMRADGWLSAGQPGTPDFGVRTIGGRTLLLARSTLGHYQVIDPFGEKLDEAPRLSPAWRARLGKMYVSTDGSPVELQMETFIPALRLAERSGWLTVENLSLQESGAPRSESQRSVADRIKSLRRLVQTDPDGVVTTGSLPYQPINDELAFVPMQVDCRDVTYLQVRRVGNEEWLRTGNSGSEWRPLDGVPEADAASGYNARITSSQAAWVKLPVDRQRQAWTLQAATGVHWVLYDDYMQPIDTGWGGKTLRAAQGSGARTLYLMMLSMTDADASVMPGIRGRVSGPGAHITETLH